MKNIKTKFATVALTLGMAFTSSAYASRTFVVVEGELKVGFGALPSVIIDKGGKNYILVDKSGLEPCTDGQYEIVPTIGPIGKWALVSVLECKDDELKPVPAAPRALQISIIKTGKGNNEATIQEVLTFLGEELAQDHLINFSTEFRGIIGERVFCAEFTTYNQMTDARNALSHLESSFVGIHTGRVCN